MYILKLAGHAGGHGGSMFIVLVGDEIIHADGDDGGAIFILIF